MRKLWLLGAFGVVALVSALFGPSRSAQAIAPFKKEFDALYVKKTPGSDTDKALAEAVSKAKCGVCHGKTKKTRNPYGDSLDKLLDKKADAKNLEKIRAALQSVENEHSKPGDNTSPTFGELIKQGKLPGGEPPPAADDDDEDEEE